MRILNFDEFKIERETIIDAIVRGAVFIYPTDTIYGLGCNAENSSSVKKIRLLKARASNPFSVITPSIEWVYENCVITKEGEEWLDKMPGPYTLIFKLKNKNNCVAKEVNPGIKTLGIRMPRHWFMKVVAEANIPIVTTSVNRSGEDYMTSLEDLDASIKSGVDFILYEGEKIGKPSKIIDLAENVKVIER